jgi:hypothetical protein
MAGLKISSTKEMKKRDGEKGTENHFFPPLLVVDKTRAAVGSSQPWQARPWAREQ